MYSGVSSAVNRGPGMPFGLWKRERKSKEYSQDFVKFVTIHDGVGVQQPLNSSQCTAHSRWNYNYIFFALITCGNQLYTILQMKVDAIKYMTNYCRQSQSLSSNFLCYNNRIFINQNRYVWLHFNSIAIAQIILYFSTLVATVLSDRKIPSTKQPVWVPESLSHCCMPHERTWKSNIQMCTIAFSLSFGQATSGNRVDRLPTSLERQQTFAKT